MMRFLIPLVLFAGISCGSCHVTDVETDSLKITRLVSDFEPPMLSILEEMEEAGFEVSPWKPLFERLPTSLIYVEDLRGLVPLWEEFMLVAPTLTQARLGGFLEGVKIELEIL